MTEISDQIRQLHDVYRTGVSDLATDFFGPCLAECTNYRRAAGYFSSSALKTWAQGLPRLLRNDAKIHLLISPELSSQDFRTLETAVNDDTRREVLQSAADHLIEEAMRFASDPEDKQLRLRLFCWLVASGYLEIRFVIPKHVEDAGIFHDKCGIFDFSSGDVVAFTGSANETISGHRRNIERVHVFRSWIPADSGRLEATVDDFEMMWHQRDDTLIVMPLSAKSLNSIKTHAPSGRPDFSKPSPVPPKVNKWRHQDAALEAFIASRAGILEMATGTGKTRTSLKILARLIEDKKIDCAIICTDGNDLLAQWHQEILTWGRGIGLPWSVFRHFGPFHERELFLTDPIQALIVISRLQLPRLLNQYPPTERARCIIIHDEVHGLGSESNVAALRGEHQHFGYRLGLSATPERTYDKDGTDFILQELGPVIFRFGLEEAIARGILCEMEYVPLPYQLSDEDRRRLQSVHARRAASAQSGTPMSDEEFYNELARVYKTAEYKPLVFNSYVRNRPESLDRSIVFVDNREYGDRVLQIIAKYTHLYRTYYAEDDAQDLKTFADSRIDCLITCHRISQGIDIRSLTTVVLFASARARLETIQRIGRCLRSDPDVPDKCALVVDFVLDDFEADTERCAWLTSLSQIKRSE
ncbi:MAG: helicase-like [Gallionellaceae bacterium]|nr:MAG: helicase-like [Gallionellaceae bacterium]